MLIMSLRLKKECDEVVVKEPNISIPVNGVRRLLGEKNIITSVKLTKCSGKKKKAARARHWNRFNSCSTRSVEPTNRFLPNLVAFFVI